MIQSAKYTYEKNNAVRRQAHLDYVASMPSDKSGACRARRGVIICATSIMGAVPEPLSVPGHPSFLSFHQYSQLLHVSTQCWSPPKRAVRLLKLMSLQEARPVHIPIMQVDLHVDLLTFSGEPAATYDGIYCLTARAVHPCHDICAFVPQLWLFHHLCSALSSAAPC